MIAIVIVIVIRASVAPTIVTIVMAARRSDIGHTGDDHDHGHGHDRPIDTLAGHLIAVTDTDRIDTELNDTRRPRRHNTKKITHRRSKAKTTPPLSQSNSHIMAAPNCIPFPVPVPLLFLPWCLVVFSFSHCALWALGAGRWASVFFGR